MNMPSKKHLFTAEQNEEQFLDPKVQQRQLITVVCLTIFPLIYLIGKTVLSAL